MPRLSIQIPDGEEAVYDFDNSEVTIGRGDENSIPVPHDSLSTQHAQLTQSGDGEWTLMDLGSTNGTFVNGSQISEALLPDESEILFGQVSAHFSISGDGGSAETYTEETPSFGPLESSGRPANFVSISPFSGKTNKKSPAGKIVVTLAVLSIIVSIALAAIAFTSLA